MKKTFIEVIDFIVEVILAIIGTVLAYAFAHYIMGAKDYMS